MDFHVECFPENLGEHSKEQDEWFHKDIKVMEQQYKRRWDNNMMADYCWMLKRDSSQKESMKRKMPLRRSFEWKSVL